MIGGALALLGAVRARPALLWGLGALALVLALWWGASALLRDAREDGARDATRQIEADQSKEVKDAIKRSAPGPRPSGGEFLECLRRGGPGCL